MNPLKKPVVFNSSKAGAVMTLWVAVYMCG